MNLIDRLESRRLLAASAVFDPAKSYLRVFGSDAGESIEIRSVSSATTGNSTGYRVQVLVDNRIVLNDVPPSINRVIIYGGGGDDLIRVPANFITSIFHPINSGIHEVSSRAVACSVDGGSGDDTIFTGNANDTVSGNGGKDVIFTADGDDLVAGGASADRIDGGAGRDEARGNGGNDRIDGGDGDDTLFGSAGNDSLAGQNGNDTLNGSDGNDQLTGGLGGDQHFGGKGIDTANYTGRTERLLIELLDSVPESFRAIPGLDDQPYPRNSLLFDDGRYAFDEDVKKFIPPAGDDDYFGTGRLEGDGIIEVESVQGGEGDDVILGNEDDNHLSGGGGDDWIFAGAGHDTLLGNAGDDLLFSVDTRNGFPTALPDENDSNSAEGSDRIDGGPGKNFARFDPRDQSRIASVQYRELLGYLFS